MGSIGSEVDLDLGVTNVMGEGCYVQVSPGETLLIKPNLNAMGSH